MKKRKTEAQEAMQLNKIEDILTKDEEIILKLKPETRVFILEGFLKGLPLALIWAAFDTVMIYFLITKSGLIEENPNMIWFLVFFFGLHLVPVWLWIANIVKRVAGFKNVEYALTDKRAIVRSGVIGIDFKFIYYTDIESVNVKVGILERIFNVGDVVIKSKTQTVVFDDITTPYMYSGRIIDTVRDLKADVYFPNDLRPEENHGYNTKYVKRFDDNEKK